MRISPHERSLYVSVLENWFVQFQITWSGC